jgi:HEAT repeat protein
MWKPQWLPVFADGWGDWHVVVSGRRAHRVLEISFVDLPDTYTAFADLPHMFETLARRWRAGAYWQGDGGSVEEDPRAVAALYREEDGEPPDLDQLLADMNDGPLETYTEGMSRMRTRLYPAAVPGLVQMLHSGTPRGRKAAAELLGSIGDATAKAALEDAVKDDSDEIVRIYATRSLEEIARLAGA